jgi:hypothetical protein
MVLWLIIGCVGVAATLVIAGAYQIVVYRYRQMCKKPHDDPEICVYLHDEHVMNMYRQGDYKALRQEVESRTRRNRTRGVDAKARGVGAHAGQESEEEEVIRYIKDVGPIRAIRTIIADLEQAENIVYVDLLNRSLEPGSGLDRALKGRKGSRQRSAALWDLNPFVFVSIKGMFRVTGRDNTTTTFLAPYGDPADPGSEPRQVSVTCETALLRLEDIPSGSFPARCLGKIQRWDPGTQKLVIYPVLAIFQ